MPELEELRRLFYEAVLVRGPYDEYSFPTGFAQRFAFSPFECWFRENIPGIDPCGGDHGPDHLEAAHWIKRQQVERWVFAQVIEFCTDEAREVAAIDSTGSDWARWGEQRAERLVALAAWDPRSAVPACEKHHRRFDSHRMPTLVVPRRLVPDHVVEFVHDYGLETALEDRNPEEVYLAPE